MKQVKSPHGRFALHPLSEFILLAISEFTSASISKRVYVRSLCYDYLSSFTLKLELTGNFHDGAIWLKLPHSSFFFFSYLNLYSQWGKNNNSFNLHGTSQRILALVVKWRNHANVLFSHLDSQLCAEIRMRDSQVNECACNSAVDNSQTCCKKLFPRPSRYSIQ